MIELADEDSTIKKDNNGKFDSLINKESKMMNNEIKKQENYNLDKSALTFQTNESDRNNNPNISENPLLQNNEKKIITNEDYTFIKRLFHWLFPICYKVDTVNNRKILFNSEKNNNRSYIDNSVKNTKYNIFTLVPIVLFVQFSLFSNQFYFLMVATQFVDVLKVGFLFSYLAPLVFVLLITIVKEGYDDYYRYCRDTEANNQITKRYRLKKVPKQYANSFKSDNYITVEETKSSELKIGDIILIEQDKRLPADVVVLASKTQQVFIRTDQLDGETDWKLRKPVKLLEQYFDNLEFFMRSKASKVKNNKINNNNQQVYDTNLKKDTLKLILNNNKETNNIAEGKYENCDIELISSPPSKQIYEYFGYLELRVNLENNETKSIKEPLFLENTMWANTIMASHSAIGVVIGIGKETRAQMNSNSQRNKMGKLDLELNTLSKALFLIMMICSLVIMLLKERGVSNPYFSVITYFRFMVLLCAIIPISLRVNLDIAKTVNSNFISTDKKIEGAIARNSTLPEELGRVEYLFCDKTGTLTKNDMIFKSLALESEIFTTENIEDMKFYLQEDLKKSTCPLKDVLDHKNKNINQENDVNLFTKKRLKRSKTKLIRDSITAMAICNSVNVVNEEETEKQNITKRDNYYSNQDYLDDKELDAYYKNELGINFTMNNTNYFESCNSPDNKTKRTLDKKECVEIKDNIKISNTESNDHTGNMSHNKENINNNFNTIDNTSNINSNSLYKDKDNDDINTSLEEQFKQSPNTEGRMKTNLVKKIADSNLNYNKEKRDSHENLTENEVSIHLDIEADKLNKELHKHIPNYQASSPDEVALVKTAAEFGCQLNFRDEKKLILRNFILEGNSKKKSSKISDTSLFTVETKSITNSENKDSIYNNANYYDEEYEVLQCFPFSSETKRMGIILRNIEHDYVVFYLKGAESVVKDMIKEESVGYMKENCENLAYQGLRTLVFAYKLLDYEDYLSWELKYNEALNCIDNRKQKITHVMKKIEKNLDFLCVTGVEDLLQDQVLETVDSLRQAGIKVWMLTGDKVETATCIAISTGIKSKTQSIFYITDNSTSTHVQSLLETLKFSDKSNSLLIIDGACLETALTQHEALFFHVALKSASVICCRCSPTQKADILRLGKKYTNKRMCAIGDGGNDVAMIQEAHVGVGIVGKEGMQASLASDFSILTYKDLNLLLLWHGRLSYKNTATIAKFIIHRGLIISFIQFIFSFIFYFSPIPIFNGILVLGYSTVYTNLPVFSLLFDKDTEISNVLKFPNMYRQLQKGRELSIKSFLYWLMKSVFQAALIMICSVLFFENIYLKISTIAFSSLIIAELLNVYAEINKLHPVMVVSLFATLISYFFSLVFLKSILDVSYLAPHTMIKIFGVTLSSWLPFYLYNSIRMRLWPEIHEKINNLKN